MPPAHIRRLQDYLRLRADHVASGASHVQHMQKALERMNIKLHDVISSLTGVSGLAVVRAILAGERNPDRLLELCDGRIQRAKASRVKESLRGTFAEEHLFALAQALQSWEHCQGQIEACDRKLAALWGELAPPPDGQPPAPPAAARKRPGTNAPKIPHLRSIIAQLCGGEDLTILPARTEYSVLQIIGEVGADLTHWQTEKHFTAWLGIAPGSRQSGKRKGSVKRQRNRAGRLFCVIARSLVRSKDIAFSGFYRRLAARRGGLIALMALARKLAILFWRMMVKGRDYVEHGLKAYEAKVLETKQRALRRLAKQLGQQLAPMSVAT